MLQSDRSRRLAFLAQDPRPEIASVSGYCHQWHKTLTDVTRSKHVRPQQLRNKKENKERHLPALPATGKKKTLAQTVKKTLTLRPPNTPHRRTCSLDQQNCAPQNGCHGKLCQHTRTCTGLSVHVRCRFADAIETLAHVFTRCIFNWTLCRTGHVISRYLELPQETKARLCVDTETPGLC